MRTEPYYMPHCQKYSFIASGSVLRPVSSENPCLNGHTTPGDRQPADTLDDLITGSLRTLGQSIEQILEEIDARQRLGERIIESIDKQMCMLKEPLYMTAPFGPSTVTVGDPRRRTAIEKELASLETEKRHEEVGTWKDVAGLKRELRELWRDYDTEKQRARVMQG